MKIKKLKAVRQVPLPKTAQAVDELLRMVEQIRQDRIKRESLAPKVVAAYFR